MLDTPTQLSNKIHFPTLTKALLGGVDTSFRLAGGSGGHSHDGGVCLQGGFDDLEGFKVRRFFRQLHLHRFADLRGSNLLFIV